MTSTTPYPPCRSRPATQITSEQALSSLTAFLSASESTPWLHPDARITPDEIKYSANGGPQGGIILHHLRRIEKGLNGEILAPEPDDVFGPPEGDDLATGRKKGALKKSAEEEGWQDAEAYARSQTILEGDVDDRDTADAHNFNMDADADAMDLDHAPGMSRAEKEARKDAKKNRRKAEKKDKEDKKRAKG